MADGGSASAPDSSKLFAGHRIHILARVPQRSRFIKIVRDHGGDFLLTDRNADEIIGDHMRRDQPPGSLSYTWLEQCVEQQRLVDKAAHLAGPPLDEIGAIRTARPPRGGRTAFTDTDDDVLKKWVAKAKADGEPISGNEIYKQLEAQNSRHTWQSWRDRYLKYLRFHEQPPLTQQPEARAPVLAPPAEISSTAPAKARADAANDRTKRVKSHKAQLHVQQGPVEDSLDAAAGAPAKGPTAATQGDGDAASHNPPTSPGANNNQSRPDAVAVSPKAPAAHGQIRPNTSRADSADRSPAVNTPRPTGAQQRQSIKPDMGQGASRIESLRSPRRSELSPSQPLRESSIQRQIKPVGSQENPAVAVIIQPSPPRPIRSPARQLSLLSPEQPFRSSPRQSLRKARLSQDLGQPIYVPDLLPTPTRKRKVDDEDSEYVDSTDGSSDSGRRADRNDQQHERSPQGQSLRAGPASSKEPDSNLNSPRPAHTPKSTPKQRRGRFDKFRRHEKNHMKLQALDLEGVYQNQPDRVEEAFEIFARLYLEETGKNISATEWREFWEVKIGPEMRPHVRLSLSLSESRDRHSTPTLRGLPSNDRAADPGDESPSQGRSQSRPAKSRLQLLALSQSSTAADEEGGAADADQTLNNEDGFGQIHPDEAHDDGGDTSRKRRRRAAESPRIDGKGPAKRARHDKPEQIQEDRVDEQGMPVDYEPQLQDPEKRGEYFTLFEDDEITLQTGPENVPPELEDDAGVEDAGNTAEEDLQPAPASPPPPRIVPQSPPAMAKSTTARQASTPSQPSPVRFQATQESETHKRGSPRARITPLRRGDAHSRPFESDGSEDDFFEAAETSGSLRELRNETNGSRPMDTARAPTIEPDLDIVWPEDTQMQDFIASVEVDLSVPRVEDEDVDGVDIPPNDDERSWADRIHHQRRIGAGAPMGRRKRHVQPSPQSRLVARRSTQDILNGETQDVDLDVVFPQETQGRVSQPVHAASSPIPMPPRSSGPLPPRRSLGVLIASTEPPLTKHHPIKVAPRKSILKTTSRWQPDPKRDEIFVESYLDFGLGRRRVSNILARCSGDHELANDILTRYTLRKKPVPPTTKGYWHPEQDKILLEGTDGRASREMLQQHGENRFWRRKEFLEALSALERVNGDDDDDDDDGEDGESADEDEDELYD